MHIGLFDISKSKETAECILRMANDKKISRYKSDLLGSEGLSIIKSNAEYILKPESNKTTQVRIKNKIGRNDVVRVRYNDGRVLKSKYKKVEDDINSNICVIIK